MGACCGCCKKGQEENPLHVMRSTSVRHEYSPSPPSGSHKNITPKDVNIFTLEPIRRKIKEPTSKTKAIGTKKQIEKETAENTLDTHAGSVTVLDQNFDMDQDISKATKEDTDKDMPCMSFATLPNETAPESSPEQTFEDVDEETLMNKTLRIGSRVSLDPKGRIVAGPHNDNARRARKSHRRDDSAALPDKRRRESVHETIYKLGGFVLDRRTGKQVYIKPNTPFESSEIPDEQEE